jgi:hypothetical protein
MWSGWSDIVHIIDSDVVRSSDTPLQARARSFVRHAITPTVAAAAETYPELSVAESNPNQVYATEGWRGMNDWLGNGRVV